MDSGSDEYDNLEYAHEDGNKDGPKISKSAHMKALLMLISDKKERIKKILSKSATSRSPEELNEVASLLSVTLIF
jgi:transcription termination factor NusB